MIKITDNLSGIVPNLVDPRADYYIWGTRIDLPQDTVLSKVQVVDLCNAQKVQVWYGPGGNLKGELIGRADIVDHVAVFSPKINLKAGISYWISLYSTNFLTLNRDTTQNYNVSPVVCSKISYTASGATDINDNYWNYFNNPVDIVNVITETLVDSVDGVLFDDIGTIGIVPFSEVGTIIGIS